MMHHNNGSWTSDRLQNSQGADRVEDSTACVTNHCGFFARGFSLVPRNEVVLWTLEVLTQRSIETQNLIWIQARIGTRQDYNALLGSSHLLDHIHKWWWCLVPFSVFPASCEFTALSLEYTSLRVPVTRQHFHERSCNAHYGFGKSRVGFDLRIVTSRWANCCYECFVC